MPLSRIHGRTGIAWPIRSEGPWIGGGQQSEGAASIRDGPFLLFGSVLYKDELIVMLFAKDATAVEEPFLQSVMVTATQA